MSERTIILISSHQGLLARYVEKDIKHFFTDSFIHSVTYKPIYTALIMDSLTYKFDIVLIVYMVFALS